jgi:hypothetical protein
MALEILQVGDFDIPGDEVMDVGAERGGGGAVFGGEGVAVRGERWVVPLRGENAIERCQCVWELGVCLSVA